jgi:hypothetical protein
MSITQNLELTSLQTQGHAVNKQRRITCGIDRKLTHCRPVLPYAEELYPDITNLLDIVMSELYASRDAMITDVEELMRRRLVHECQEIETARQEMKKVADAYNRFVDLNRELAKRERRLTRLVCVLGPSGLKPLHDEDQKKFGEAIKTFSVAWLNQDIPVWEAMNEYLCHVEEARINEIEDFLVTMGVKHVNRQAIESALKTHPEVFKTRKVRREKYISLKDEAKD